MSTLRSAAIRAGHDFLEVEVMTRITCLKWVAATVLAALPSIAEAGPPLICHPFQTGSANLLQWGSGPGWNTPDDRYDVQRLTGETLALLDADAPVLSRMENMRRAVIYATKDRRVAEQLLQAIRDRATQPGAGRLALFDAGYLIESYKQATHLFGRTITGEDGYALVTRALEMGRPDGEMEFAAALMTQGTRSSAHLQRARTLARAESPLARNITQLEW
jgi:hypothetical protein